MSTQYKNSSPELEDWISLSEAARLRGVTRQAMSKLVKHGRFRTLNAGGRQLVHKQDVADYKALIPGRRAKEAK